MNKMDLLLSSCKHKTYFGILCLIRWIRIHFFHYWDYPFQVLWSVTLDWNSLIHSFKDTAIWSISFLNEAASCSYLVKCYASIISCGSFLPYYVWQLSNLGCSLVQVLNMSLIIFPFSGLESSFVGHCAKF